MAGALWLTRYFKVYLIIYTMSAGYQFSRNIQFPFEHVDSCGIIKQVHFAKVSAKYFIAVQATEQSCSGQSNSEPSSLPLELVFHK